MGLAISLLLMAAGLCVPDGFGAGPSNVKVPKQRFNEITSAWPDAPNFALTFDPLKPSSPRLVSKRAAFNSKDDYSGLPREGAYELVDAYCSGCHSLQIVMQQRASKARWAELLVWMSDKQNMPPLEEDETAVLAYLSEHYGDQ